MPGRVEGTDTMFFIKKEEVPPDRFKDVTYGKFVVDYRENKEEKERVRLTVGGDRINYPDEVATPTADLLTVKLMINSVISTPHARWMTVDIKNFYLNTPLKRYEYLKLRLNKLPEDVIKQYKLKDKATPEGYIYVEVRKGMYGLPQAGLLAQELLEKRLNEKGYRQSKYTPGLWKHDRREIQFTLVVDDFGIKYVGKENATHLIETLKEYYTISEDWGGNKYVGLTIDWDYKGRQVHLSMPGYIEKALKRFGHERPRKRQDQPHEHVPPEYGIKQQFVREEDESPEVSQKEQQYIRQVLGTLLYNARAVDPTLIMPLSALASEQARPTEKTMKKIKQLLDYIASQEEAVITYRASDMILAIHSDASYLSEAKARSRAGGHHFLSENVVFPPNNGAVLNISTIIRAVMSSAAEAELGALFLNAKAAIPIKITLEEMGHNQPQTPIQTDNSTAQGVITNKIQPKATKAMDMRFHWLRDREAQGQFRFYWRSGKDMRADYFTKHHPAPHHRLIRPEILTPWSKLMELRERNKNEAKPEEEKGDQVRTRRQPSITAARVC